MVETNADEARAARISALLEAGLGHHERGQLAEARTLYEAILALAPTHADALHLLGVVHLHTGRADLAEVRIRQALVIEPEAAHYYNNLGNALRAQGRPGEAILNFGAALRFRPGSAPILINLGNAFRDAGDFEEAIAVFRNALTRDSGLVEGWYNLANTLCDLGCLAEAEAPYREALRLRPGYADAAYNLGNALVRLNRPAEAEAAYRTALRSRADHAETHNNLGVVLQELGRLDEAEASLYAALRLKPTYAEAHYNLGWVLQAHNRIAEAAASYRRALDAKPDYGEARLALVMGQLPILYTDTADIAPHRRAYEEQLRELADSVGRGEAGPGLANAIGSSQPFFLPYQGEDDRELQSLYGTLACRVLADRQQPATLPAVPEPDRRLRLGLVSGFFLDHTIWKLFLEGWLARLDRNRFEIFGFHTGLKRDRLTDTAAAACDRFAEGRWPGTRWREIILGHAPDILIYPEIGMDPMAAQLAAQRLAPVQCVCWGHPNTTGLPTLDYFLSSDLMEPPDAADLYTERLIRLPNLGTCWQPAPAPPPTELRHAFGLRPDAVAYWCGQALYKYLPRYDEVFPRIAREAGDCQFVFIEYAKSREVTDQFKARLTRAFAAWGLRADDHCVVLRPMPQERFIAAVGQCDVLLDSLGWSGGRSTLDCLAHDAPIVTLPGPFMRGRHTAAILRRIGVTETIAASIDGYVEIATRLARDSQWRATVRARMAAGRHLAFDDRDYIAALENFLDNAARLRTATSDNGPNPALISTERGARPLMPTGGAIRTRTATAQA